MEMSFEADKSGVPRLPNDFDFDYELLDKLLLGLDRVDDGGVVVPMPGTDERNNRLGSEWIRQLEQDLVNFIDDDSVSVSQSQSQSVVSTSPGPIGDDFFDREWNDISTLFSLNNYLSTSPSQSTDSNDLFNPQAHHSRLEFIAADKSALMSPQDALNLNRELQGNLRSILERSTFLEQQQRELERVTDLLSSQVDKKFKKKNSAFPFWPTQDVPSLSVLDRIVSQARGITPLSSQLDPRLQAIDTKVKEYTKHLKVIPRWTFKERSSLAHGIQAQNEKILLEIIQAKGTHSLEECKAIIASFSEIDLLMNVNGLDWELISSYFVQSRSAIDSRLQWTINDHPMINRSPLFEDSNKIELENLKKIIPKVFKQVNAKGLPEGFCSPWQLIASQLGTNRTAIQCFMMYQRKLNPNFLKGKWTPEEDEQLMAALRLYGTQNWQAVAQLIDGRTGQQCLHRYEKAINPEIKRGRWASDEDDLLRIAVRPFLDSQRINWATVQKSIPGRTDVQCRERWVNILDPSISAAPFTAAEDEELLNLVQIHGTGNWSKLSQEYGGKRTDNQLWRRWKQISTRRRKVKGNTKLKLPLSKRAKKKN